MSGRTELFLPAIMLISLLAAGTDVLKGRIYNWLTLPALLTGLTASTVHGGLAGFGDAAAGAGLGLLLYGWMFFIRMMGAGDVKLLMALGAWGGAAYTVRVALLSVIVGGAFAVIMLAARGRFVAFLRKMQVFLISLFVRDLDSRLPEVDRKQTMPYGVPIAIAAIWVAANDPFSRWGLSL